MAAFICVEWTKKDEAALARYATAARPTIENHGGTVVALGPSQVVDGTVQHENMVLISFETRAAALEWFNSPEYQSAVPDRIVAMDARITLVG